MQNKLSRRSLLKLSGGILAAAPFVRMPQVAQAHTFAREAAVVSTPARKPLGRAMANNIPIRESADVKATVIRNLKINELVELTGQVTAPGPTTYNSIWYQTPDGFVHSAFVYPCENLINTPTQVLPEGGAWAEVSVPMVDVRSKADPKAALRDKFIYGTVYRAVKVVEGVDKQLWYQLSDEYAGSGFFAPAEQIRVIPEAEFAPISPEVALENKRIDVNLKEQTATAYEFDKPVFSARVATGGSYRQPDGGSRQFGTTRGEHRIFRKIAGQRMYGGTPGFDYYNLPGVPWVSYFTYSGIAFHGSYWHNDYGRPRSHGCVNMYADDAKWVFRWTMPVVPAYEKQVAIAKRTDGSLVKVF
jgi:lipoprotein-anchoring transpeptidase ErfK/SrfK